MKSVDDVPADVARAALATLEHTYMDRGSDWLEPMLQTIPWIAKAAPEELFVPRAWCASMTTDGYDGDESFDLVERLASVYKPHEIETVRVEKMPGRNDACSCGSGKKYKRCCG